MKKKGSNLIIHFPVTIDLQEAETLIASTTDYSFTRGNIVNTPAPQRVLEMWEKSNKPNISLINKHRMNYLRV